MLCNLLNFLPLIRVISLVVSTDELSDHQLFGGRLRCRLHWMVFALGLRWHRCLAGRGILDGPVWLLILLTTKRVFELRRSNLGKGWYCLR